MTVLTIDSKVRKVRAAFGKLAGEYITEGKHREAIAVQKAAQSIDADNETLAKLYDLLTSGTL